MNEHTHDDWEPYLINDWCSDDLRRGLHKTICVSPSCLSYGATLLDTDGSSLATGSVADFEMDSEYGEDWDIHAHSDCGSCFSAASIGLKRR